MSLDLISIVRCFDVRGNDFPSGGLHMDLHATTKTKHQVKNGFLLDVVVAEGAVVLKLLPCIDDSLLIIGNSRLVLNIGLDITDSVRGLDIESNLFSSEGLHADVHDSTTRYQV